MKRGDVVEETTKIGELKDLIDRFGRNIVEKLDDGETESLALITERSGEFLICSGDAIVYRVLGAQNMSDRGVALESVLAAVGMGRQVSYQYTEDFRRMYFQKGFVEGLQGLSSLK